jgi:hypothetical protein
MFTLRFNHAPAVLVALCTLGASAMAGTFTPSMSAGSGIPPGVAPHGTGYLSIGVEQGQTSAYVTLLNVNPTNGTITVKLGGGRIRSRNSTNPVFCPAPPVVVAKDPQNCYVLAYTGSTSVDGLFAYPYNNGAQLRDQQGRIVEYQLPVSFHPYTSMFGAAAMPDGRGMVVASIQYVNSVQQVGIAYFEWGGGADWTLTKVAETTVPLPGGSNLGFGGNVSCAVTHNFDAAARWYPYRLAIGLKDASGNARIHEYRLNTKMSADLLNRYFVTPVPSDDAWHTLTGGAQNLGVAMHTGMDGRAYAAVQKESTIEVYARTGYDADQKAIWENTEHLSRTFYESLPIFVYKPVYDAAHPNDPIPVNRVGFFTSTTQSGNRGYDDAFGLARRRELPQSSVSSAGVVVGIVDGPPPIPDENLKLFGPSSVRSEFNFAYDNTSQKSTTATMGQGLTMGASATLGGEYAGFGASVEAEKEVTEKFQTSYSEQTGTRSEQYLGVSSGVFPSEDGTYNVTKRLGTLFVATMSFGGAIYEFGAMQGGQFVPTPGAMNFTQLWPKGSYNIEPRGWWMNPNGRIPGNIRSYEATPEGALLQKLQRQGLNSTAGIDSLLQAAGRRDVAPTLAVRSALSALSPGDVALLRNILDDQEAKERVAWEKAHPTRYTFRDTLKEMAKPDWGRSQPLFTTPPPEGL